MTELLERYLNGDHEAFESLYTQFYEVFLSYIKKIVKDNEAEDLTQELFFTKIQTKNYMPVPAYIFGMARNLCLDYFKKKRKYELTADGELVVKVGADPITHEQLFCGLSSLEKLLLKARYVQGYQVKEIAKALNVSQRTLNRRYGEILAKIKDNVG
jgi:RNA polymerase sigma-70 factor (ECF subfamily)